MTLIVILNAVLAVLIVGAIVALHAHAIVTEHRLRQRRTTPRSVFSEVSAPQTPDYGPARRAA